MTEKTPYNDKLGEDEQIQMEEDIASLLMHSTEEGEEVCAEAGRETLYIVLKHFRPDLFEKE